MMETAALFAAREFPEHVVLAVEERRWADLEAALGAGVPATLYSQSYEMSLFEFVVNQPDGMWEMPPIAERGLPLFLLEAFLNHPPQAGAGEEGQDWLALSVQAGQWAWGHRLLELGWPAKGAGVEGGSLHGLLRGVARRRQLRTLVNVGQLLQDLLVPLEGAEGLDAAGGEIFFKRLMSRLASRDRADPELPDQVKMVSALLRAGAGLHQPGRPLRRSVAAEVWPMEQALLVQEPGLVLALLDLHAQHGQALPKGVLSFAIEHAGMPSVRAMLSHPLVRGLEEPELVSAAFTAVGLPFPGVLLALEEVGVDLVASRDGEGWDLMQRAAQGGAVPALLLLMSRGPGLEQTREGGPSPADLLRLHQPDLCEVLGVPLVQETPKVRLLRPRP